MRRATIHSARSRVRAAIERFRSRRSSTIDRVKVARARADVDDPAFASRPRWRTAELPKERMDYAGPTRSSRFTSRLVKKPSRCNGWSLAAAIAGVVYDERSAMYDRFHWARILAF